MTLTLQGVIACKEAVKEFLEHVLLLSDKMARLVLENEEEEAMAPTKELHDYEQLLFKSKQTVQERLT